MPADFQGLDNVVAAFKSRGLPTWAVFNKKNLMHCGDGEDTLAEYLQLLADNFSGITYTLKTYKDGADDVTDLTGSSGSFTFRLDEGYSPGALRGGMYGNSMAGGLGARLAAIEKKLSIGAVGEVKETSTMGKLVDTFLGWIQDPDDVIKIVGAFKMLTGKSSSQEILQTVASLSGVEPKRAGETFAPAEPLHNNTAMNGNESFELTPAQEMILQRYAVLIDRAEKFDPEFLIHLEKLVILGETKPDTYKMALTFIK